MFCCEGFIIILSLSDEVWEVGWSRLMGKMGGGNMWEVGQWWSASDYSHFEIYTVKPHPGMEAVSAAMDMEKMTSGVSKKKMLSGLTYNSDSVTPWL